MTQENKSHSAAQDVKYYSNYSFLKYICKQKSWKEMRVSSFLAVCSDDVLKLNAAQEAKTTL